MAHDRHPETSLWHGQAHMPSVKRGQRVIDRGEGVYLWDRTGHRVLDLPASLWYCNVGHGRTAIADAVHAQMSRLATYSNFQQYATAPAIEFAEQLATAAPIEGAKVFFTSGGSDSVEVAAKLARRYWAARGQPDKTTIVSRDRCYHGLHGIGTSIAGLDPNRAGFGELVRDVVRVPHDDWKALEVLATEGMPGRIAAFFCEPVIGTGGVLFPGEQYLREVQRVCVEHDILFVVDEVICGFGRIGDLFASRRFGLVPDVLLFAKGVTSGYMPLGGAIVSGAVAEPFWADRSDLVFRHGLTYQAHASACAAGLANLDILEGEDLVERSRRLEGVLARELGRLAAAPQVAELRAGTGVVAGVRLAEPVQAAAVVDACWERGVLTRLIGDGDVLHVSPPLVIGDDEIAWAVDQIADALASVGEVALATEAGGVTQR